jgi:hypothetical protein
MNNYPILYNQLTAAINSLTVGSVFYARDCINNPPILLGKFLRRDVDANKLPGVAFYGKDSEGTNLYIKNA